MPTRSLLPLMLSCAIAGCGGSGDDPSPGTGGGSSDPPVVGADFEIQFETGTPAAAADPPGSTATGASQWLGIRPVTEMFVEAGGGDGLARHNLRLNNPPGSLKGSLHLSQSQGLRTWLTAYGTPEELSPSDEGEVYSVGLPPYARWIPTDPIAWADLLLEQIDPLWQEFGIRPDYIEIWNEPDRVEYYSGTREEFLDFYAAVAPYLRSQLPGVKIGGPGLGGWFSEMGGQDSMLFALAERAAADTLPLDFLSWHHYSIANELLDSGVVGELRDHVANLGLDEVELVVSEWNVGPSPSRWGPDYDRAHAAANYAGFVTSALQVGLDGNVFFRLHDDNEPMGVISDLDGRSPGMLTRRGIKKPVYRVFELMAPMYGEKQLAVRRPEQELNLQVYATRTGNRTRIVVSNDWVESDWVWATRCRDHGLLPGALWDSFRAVVELAERKGWELTADLLVEGGFEREDAEAIMSFWPELVAAELYETEAREIRLGLDGLTDFRVARVWRFDDQHNAPAEQREAVLPRLEAIEADAQAVAFDAAADYLTAEGWPVTGEELAAAGGVLAWTQANGVPSGIAGAAEHEYFETLHVERLAEQATLDALPELALRSETTEQAGITRDGNVLTLVLEPNSVTVLDVED